MVNKVIVEDKDSVMVNKVIVEDKDSVMVNKVIVEDKDSVMVNKVIVEDKDSVMVNKVIEDKDSVMVNKVIVEDNIECAFPNVEISLHTFLTLMVTNCTTERPFSQIKCIKNPNRTTMRQKRLESLSLLMIEANLLCQINFEDSPI
jgi:DNA (cytosine-5)-methyltransferase 1